LAFINIVLTLVSIETIWALTGEGSEPVEAGRVIKARHRGTVVDVQTAGISCKTQRAHAREIVYAIVTSTTV